MKSSSTDVCSVAGGGLGGIRARNGLSVAGGGDQEKATGTPGRHPDQTRHRLDVPRRLRARRLLSLQQSCATWFRYLERQEMKP